PKWQNQQFIPQFSTVFPRSNGSPTTDEISTLLDMYFDTTLVPHTATGRPSMRNLGGSGSTDAGDARYNFNEYIRERGDAKIHNLTDLIANSEFWTDPQFQTRKASLQSTDTARTLANAGALQTRFAAQAAIFLCFAQMKLDAVVYPSGNIPPGILTSPAE